MYCMSKFVPEIYPPMNKPILKNAIFIGLPEIFSHTGFLMIYKPNLGHIF